MPPMKIDIVTVFPKMFDGFLGESIVSRAVRMGKVGISVRNLRDYSADRRRRVDDKPFSGGPGMLMTPQPWFSAVEACLGDGVRPAPGGACRVVMMTPAGAPYCQRKAEEFAACEHLVFICGHYEGIDARVDTLVTDFVSMGDFVLTGGEIPAAAVVDSVVRLIPGVLGGGEAATANESFNSDGILEAPQYTHPPEFRGMKVPEVLLSGDHAKIEAWKRKAAVEFTRKMRPELLGEGGSSKFKVQSSKFEV